MGLCLSAEPKQQQQQQQQNDASKIGSNSSSGKEGRTVAENTEQTVKGSAVGSKPKQQKVFKSVLSPPKDPFVSSSSRGGVSAPDGPPPPHPRGQGAASQQQQQHPSLLLHRGTGAEQASSRQVEGSPLTPGGPRGSGARRLSSSSLKSGTPNTFSLGATFNPLAVQQTPHEELLHLEGCDSATMDAPVPTTLHVEGGGHPDPAQPTADEDIVDYFAALAEEAPATPAPKMDGRDHSQRRGSSGAQPQVAFEQVYVSADQADVMELSDKSDSLSTGGGGAPFPNAFSLGPPRSTSNHRASIARSPNTVDVKKR